MQFLLSPRNIILGCVTLLVLIVAVYYASPQTQKKNTLTIKNKITITVDIADNDTTRAQGYSGHAPISFNEGMLFVFPVSNFYTFWMKDMLFDLDFIYIREGSVVHILENVPAPQNNGGEVAYANSPVSFNSLLEVKSGFVKKYKIKKNDIVIVH